MDISKDTIDLIKHINAHGDNREIVSKACECFDFAFTKEKNLSVSDRKFLKFIANTVGIPQYYQMLCEKKRIDEQFNEVDLSSFCSDLQTSVLYTADDVYLHKYQKEVLDKFNIGCKYRLFLSASTSFGKTFLVFEILRKMQYSNVLLVFPTIALLSENLLKIFSDKRYSWIRKAYSIHTLSDIDTDSFPDKNIFLYTPERYLSFNDKYPNIHFDFIFVDEIYKIDNTFIIDEDEKENERDIAYRIAISVMLKDNDVSCLLAGPYIKISQSGSFENFLKYYEFEVQDFNDLEIVNKRVVDITKKKTIISDNFDFEYEQPSKKRIDSHTLVEAIIDMGENVIVYSKSPVATQKYANALVQSNIGRVFESERLDALIKHLGSIFENKQGENWIVTKALKLGIGIHHGCVPKYVQQEIIDLFNKGILTVLIATTTITEGVNTCSKNIIITSSKKGRKDLKKFDALNIEGRAGRFLQHFSGRIFIADKQFNKTIEMPDEEIQHKNFQKDINKSDVEIRFVNPDYLNSHDQQILTEILELIENVGIDKDILKQFKTISDLDKCKLYPSVLQLTQAEIAEINNTSFYIKRNSIPCKLIQIIIDKTAVVFPERSQLYHLSKSDQSKPYCILTYLIYYYLKDGFVGSVNYSIDNGKDVDQAAIDAARFAFTTLKYEVVKYFGLFNLIFKVWQAKELNRSFDEIKGIDLLLNKCEYSAITPMGRKASDFGVTPNIIKYYDATTNSEKQKIKSKMDKFEQFIFDKVSKVIGS